LDQRLAGRIQNRRGAHKWALSARVEPKRVIGTVGILNIRHDAERCVDRRVVSIPQWAALVGLADDGRSLAMARKLVAKGGGPKVVRVGRRDGIRLRDHAQWVRSRPWAKYLKASAAAEREKHQRIRSQKRRRK
jgi:hypothetical protein